MTRAAAEHEERVAVRAAVDARRGSAQGAAASSADKPPQGGAVVGGVRARLATEAGTALEPRKVSRWFDNLANKGGVGGSCARFDTPR